MLDDRSKRVDERARDAILCPDGRPSIDQRRGKSVCSRAGLKKSRQVTRPEVRQLCPLLSASVAGSGSMGSGGNKRTLWEMHRRVGLASRVDYRVDLTIACSCKPAYGLATVKGRRLPAGETRDFCKNA